MADPTTGRREDDRDRPRRPETTWWGRVGTVRVRTTVLAVVVVGVALAVGAVALVVALRRSLTEGLRTSAELRARDVAVAVAGATSPASVPLADEEDVLVQVVDASGTVVAGSPNVARQGPVAMIGPGRDRRVNDVSIIETDRDEPSNPDRDSEDFLVTARSASSSAGPVTVLVGRALDPVTESTSALTRFLVLGFPPVLLVVGGMAWLVAGRALAPVESMRREVAEISATRLDRRVADPPGTDEITRLAHTLNSMLDRLEQAQRRQHRFVSDASHELRSPVAAIRQQAEVTLAHPAEADAEEMASEVLAETERLQRLVDDLLVVARADEGTLQLSRREVDLDDVVLEEAGRLRAGTPLQIDTTAVSAGRVLGDPALLARVLRNLGDNAARHAHRSVVFRLAQADGRVDLVIDDDGPGIPPDQRARVFERFVRLDDARARDTGGSGLGLAIVAEVVAGHGGTVTAGESPLGGARFEITLPGEEFSEGHLDGQ